MNICMNKYMNKYQDGYCGAPNMAIKLFQDQTMTQTSALAVPLLGSVDSH